MRVCFVVESGTDVRLIEGLAERYELLVVARKIVGGVEISQRPEKSVAVLVGPASRLKFAILIFKYLFTRREQFDWVVVQGYAVAALAANLASLFTSIPTTMLVCSPVEAYYLCRKVFTESGKPFSRRELYGLQVLARLNALIGRSYIVLSQHLAETVRQHGSRLAINIVPIYGVDTEIFAPACEVKTVLKARLGLPTSGALVFFSSRIAPEKDSETLLRAFKILLDQGRDLWLLHRSGGYESFLRDAKRFGISERVIATDAVHPHKQLPDDYRACDLCVQASREEGLGFSPLEALACGVPVVAASVGGLRETIIDGQTGWLYPVGNVQALVRCMETALDNPDEAARRSTRGREMVQAKYDKRATFRRLEEVRQAIAKTDVISTAAETAQSRRA